MEPLFPNFIPIVYGQTVDEAVGEWRFGGDAELQNIILTLYYRLKDHDKILCAVSGGYDSDIMLDMIERFGGPRKNNIHIPKHRPGIYRYKATPERPGSPLWD